MKKLLYAGLIALSAIMLTVGCVPNNPSTRNNRLIKKSTNFITQDNANGRKILDPLAVKAIYNYNAQNKVTKATVYHAPLGVFQIREVYTFSYNSDHVMVDMHYYDLNGTPSESHEYYKLFYNGNNITRVERSSNMDSSDYYSYQFFYNGVGQLTSVIAPDASFSNFIYAGDNLVGFDKSYYDMTDSSLVNTHTFSFQYSDSTTDRREINVDIEQNIFTFNNVNGLSLFKMTGLAMGDYTDQLLTKFKVSNTLHKQGNLFIENDLVYDISYDRDSLNRITAKHNTNYILQNEPDVNGDFDNHNYYDYY